MLPMSKDELAAILANPISSLTPADIRRILDALNRFAHDEGATLDQLADQFPTY